MWICLSMLCISWWVSMKPTLRFGVRSSLWILLLPLPRWFFLWLFKKKNKKKEIGTASTTSFHAFAIKKGSDLKNKINQKNCLICARCGIQGHTKAQCYKLNDYPPNYKKNKSISTATNHSNSGSMNKFLWVLWIMAHNHSFNLLHNNISNWSIFCRVDPQVPNKMEMIPMVWYCLLLLPLISLKMLGL